MQDNFDFVYFMTEAAGPLCIAGHVLCVAKAVAWFTAGTKPVAHIAKDVILPCLRKMVEQDDIGWGPVRTYVLEMTKETDSNLRTGVRLGRNDAPFGFGVEVGPVLGKRVIPHNTEIGAGGGGGGRGRTTTTTTTAAATLARLADSSSGGQSPPLLGHSHPRQDYGEPGTQLEEEVLPKRKKRRRSHTSEELKHDGSESEVETPDTDYEDDGFCVSDSQLEFESGAETCNSASDDSDEE